jgi:hypothetical protein
MEAHSFAELVNMAGKLGISRKDGVGSTP